MLLNYINEITIYIMEDVAIHGSSGNDVYKVVPKDEEISKIKKKKLKGLLKIFLSLYDIPL